MDAPDYFEESPWFPNPLICARDMAITGTREGIHRLPWDGIGAWLNGTWHWLSRAKYNDPTVILVPLLLAIAMTLLRIFLNWSIFRVNPTPSPTPLCIIIVYYCLQRIPKWYKLTPEAADKFPESIWKTAFYSITWTWGLYLISHGRDNTFFNLRSHWDCMWRVHGAGGRAYMGRGGVQLSIKTVIDICNVCSMEPYQSIGTWAVLAVHDSDGILLALYICFCLH